MLTAYDFLPLSVFMLHRIQVYIAKGSITIEEGKNEKRTVQDEE